jgi:DNA-binding beta-propeller fold protein YncE
VKQHAIVSERYTTVSMIRTMEDILGLEPLNVHDAHVRPMTAAFDVTAAKWDYHAIVPAMLRSTQLPLPLAARGTRAAIAHPLHDAAFWAAQTKSFDFRGEDRLDAASYNRILWQGMKPNQPYPANRSATDLRR